MKETALAVINDEQKNAMVSYTGTLFSDIDFQGLNSIIDKISENKDELTDGMREAATKFADDWDNLVVKRLEFKRDKLEALESFFSSNDRSFHNIANFINERSYYRNGDVIETEGVIYTVIEILRTKESWHDYADRLSDLVDQYEEIETNSQENAPQLEDYYTCDEEDMSYSDRVLAQKEYELAKAKFCKEAKKEEFKFRTEFVNLRKEMRSNKELKEFLKAMKSQLKRSREAISVVHEKSSLVKLAINFGGTSLLSALQELHEFQKTL